MCKNQIRAMPAWNERGNNFFVEESPVTVAKSLARCMKLKQD